MRDASGKLYAIAQSIRNNENLVFYARGAVTINACDSMSEALRIADYWNSLAAKASSY